MDAKMLTTLAHSKSSVSGNNYSLGSTCLLISLGASDLPPHNPSPTSTLLAEFSQTLIILL